MAMSLNRVQLIGNITRDPELKQIPGGQTVATFSVATNFTWKDQSGQKQERVEFHNIVAWRRLAEIAGQYLKKGSKVFVEGRLQTRDWEGQDGVKRYRTEIVADNLIMLDRKGATSEGGMGYDAGAANQQRQQRSVQQGASGSAAASEGVDMSVAPSPAGEEVAIEDLPF